MYTLYHNSLNNRFVLIKKKNTCDSSKFWYITLLILIKMWTYCTPVVNISILIINQWSLTQKQSQSSSLVFKNILVLLQTSVVIIYSIFSSDELRHTLFITWVYEWRALRLWKPKRKNSASGRLFLAWEQSADRSCVSPVSRPPTAVASQLTWRRFLSGRE